MRKIRFSILFLTAWLSLHSQMVPQALNFRRAVQAGTRTAREGVPGDQYWINSADYKIEVELNPWTGELTGSEDITYYNHSPDTLKEMVIALYQNFYKKGVCADYNTPDERRTEGVRIHRLVIDGKSYEEGEKARQVRTNLYVKLDSPILPGARAQLHIEWSYLAREGNTVRTGNYGDGRHFTAYFYPKIAVYDDLDGWDKADYLGITEFYSDFNNYDVRVTVPKDFVVWGSGLLQNPDEVLMPRYARRLKKAMQSSEVVHIIDSMDIKRGGITAQRPKLTWHFKSEKSPDFAFATDHDHLWDGWSVLVDPATGRRAFVAASYEKESKDFYEVARLAGEALSKYSTRFPGVPYPFPAMTIFNAPSGMEFPMMCNDGSTSDLASTVGLTFHEIAHTYFPFLMGINERKYAWMDEGWATYFPSPYFKEYVPDYDFHDSRIKRYLQIAGSEAEVPVITLSKDQHRRLIYRNSSYNKPYLAYYFLRQLLGEQRFTHCLQQFIHTWSYKHPSPYDFFNSFNRHAGRNLDWYWNNWFFEKNYADLRIEKVTEQGAYVTNTGGLFVPVVLTVVSKTGEHRVVRRGLDFWRDGLKKRFIMLPFQKEEILSVKLGDKTIPDAWPDDNVWRAQ